MAFDISNLAKGSGIAGGLGSIAGGIAGLFGNKNKNPADAANNYLSQIPESIRPYFQPFIDAGNRARPQLQNNYDQLLNNPNAIYNKLGEGYQQSPGYQFKLQQALAGANNAQAAGGMLGTPQHQQVNMGVANGIASQDYNDYLNQVKSLYGMGLQGEQGLNNQGFEASRGYGENLGSILGQQAQYAYEGQNAENEGNEKNWSNIFSGAASALPWLFL